MRYLALLTIFVSAAACGDVSGDPAGGADSPRAAMVAQIGLVRSAATEHLRPHFTERLRNKFSDDDVVGAAKDLGEYDVDDLIGTIEMEDADRAKIKMANGRTLTTLVRRNGRWLADTIWFR